MGIEYIDVASRYHMGIASAHRLMGGEGGEEGSPDKPGGLSI